MIIDLFDKLLELCGVWGLSLILAVVIMFAVQLRYYIRYGRIVRHPDISDNDVEPNPVSVVTVIPDSDYFYLGTVLPLILAQEGVEFELVLVDTSEDSDLGGELKMAAMNDSRITLLHLKANPHFPFGNKTALNVGIKAARYDNIIITTTDALPGSTHWLSLMSSGLSDADILLGYCTVGTGSETGGRRIRLDNLNAAMRWISSALRGRPYRGTMRNMGFKRSLYFEKGGFNRLDLNIGEDDLYLQYIAPGSRVCAVLDSEAVMQRMQRGGKKWWRSQRLLYSNAYRFYPGWVKRYIGGELWSRVFFYAVAVAALIVCPPELKIAAGALILIRMLIVILQTIRIGRRLGERNIWPVVPVSDLFAPIREALMCIKRHMKKTPGLWR